jgi:hypothetical protein
MLQQFLKKWGLIFQLKKTYKKINCFELLKKKWPEPESNWQHKDFQS